MNNDIIKTRQDILPRFYVFFYADFSSSFILNRNFRNPAKNFGLLTTTIFTMHSSVHTAQFGYLM